MVATAAATLEIQLIADVVRLQKDMRAMQQAVASATGGMEGSMKSFGRATDAAMVSANDNMVRFGRTTDDVKRRIEALTGVTSSQVSRSASDIAAYGAELDRLRAKYNPVFAVIQQYRQSLEEVRRAHATGAISAEEMGAAISRLRQQALGSIAVVKGVSTAQGTATKSTGQMQAGIQQLGFQFGDFTTQVSSGTSITQAFAQQVGQASQALTLMGGGSGALGRTAAFLSSGWGIALTAALPLMAMFISKLTETKEETKKLKTASEEAADAVADLWKNLGRSSEISETATKAVRSLFEAQGKLAQVNRDIAGVEASRDKSQGYRLIELERRRTELEKQVREAQDHIESIRDAGRGMELQQRAQEKVRAADEAATKALREREKATRDLGNAQANLARFASPLAGARQTGRFGEQRATHKHAGIDLAAPSGTAINAPQVGVVQAVGFSPTLGKYVVIDHGSGTKTRYGHMSVQTVEVGQAVGQGDMIGRVGSTGRSTGPHLHYEVLVNGKPVDPSKGIFPLDPVHIAEAGDRAREALEREAQKSQDFWDKLMSQWQMDLLTDAGRKLAANRGADWAEFNRALEEQVGAASAATSNFYDELAQLRDLAGELDFGSIFGRGGEAIEDMLSSVGRLSEAQRSYQRALDEAAKMRPEYRTEAEAKAEKEYHKAQLNGTVAMLGATKKLFNEKSAGYKIITTAEKVLAALQLANTIKAMVLDTTHTASSVANSTARAGADQAAGAAKIFSQLGWWAFPVVAAMIAVMASLGMGGGGSASMPSIPSAEDVQAQIGTGTVLGDNSAQSQSLGNALNILAENSNEDLEYSNAMVRHLRNIDDGIGALTAQVARQLNLSGGSFDTSGFRLGQTGSSGILGLFGSSTTRTLWDQGIEIFQSSVADILAEGVDAQIYNVIQQVKKSNGFLGIGGGTKTSYQTVTGSVPGEIEEQMKLIVGDVADSVVAMAKQLGFDVSGLIADIELPAAKLSFKDMGGEEIEAALQAYFSSIADVIAGAAFNGSGEFNLQLLQKAGEGLFETAARITREIMTVNTGLSSIGINPATIMAGGNLMGAAQNSGDLIGQFGGMDAFQDAVSNFADQFLTEAERMAPIVAAVRAEMDRLGAAGVTTNDQFKELVQGLNLNTESGRQMFAELMAVAPAFAKVTEYMGSLDAELGETAKTAEQLAQIAKQSRQLDIQLMEAQGKAAEALAARRQDELAALDESLRAKQQEVWAAQDAAQAARDLAAASEDLANKAAAAASRMASLDIRLAEAQGNSELALSLRRQQELDAALSDAERAKLHLIYAAEDAAARAQKAAEQQARAEQAAAEAAQRADEIAQQRRSMEIELLRLQGKETQALALERQAELAVLDKSLHALQQQVWAEQDLAKKREDAAAKVADARGVLSDAFDRTASGLRETIDKFKDLRATLVDVRKGLFAGEGFDSFATLQRRLMQTSALANTGQEQAMRDLPGAAQDFLGAARNQAGSLVEYQLQVARVARMIDQAIGAADEVVDYNELELEALEASVEGLIDVGEKVVSVRDAIEDLREAMAEENAALRDNIKTLIRGQNTNNRLLNDVTEGGFGMKTQAAE